MNTPRLAITATAILTSMIALTACSPDGQANETGAGDVVRIGTLKGQPHLMHPYFYEDVDSDTTYEIVTFDTSPDIKNAVVSGAIDAGIAGLPSAIAGAAAGQDVVVVASAADGGSGIVGRDGLTDINDLAGLKVGYSKGSSQEILLRLTLAAAGLDAETDVELVNLPFADMASALQAGRIDAFSSAETGPATALQAGATNVASPYETPIGAVNIALYVAGDTITEDPEFVQELVNTHANATELMDSDHDEWITRLVDTFGVDEAVARQASENVWLRWDIDEDYTTKVTALTSEMLTHAQIDTEPQVSDFVNTTFVSAVTVN
ncbi:ABC transporter substrate-binding protein [Jonesia quinghaiensis]|uniref:ABC transporter substrate-binding protein n=1 Tax=Jonesia quinghaiensis TaxID=262806 RepID=UPI00041AE203|nr:NrtA/SsuA/CpmA family ABC transporter substrate-binding protein [Jonesia quinghaiensis]